VAVADAGDLQRLMTAERIDANVELLVIREGRVVTLPIVPDELDAG
jgi:hypothetical protein